MERIHPIGQRAIDVKYGMRIWYPVILIISLIPAQLSWTLIWDYDWDSYYEPEEVYNLNYFWFIFSILLSLLLLYLVYMLINNIITVNKNNKNPNPAIGITDDGKVILFHAKGKKEYLEDKIINVRSKAYTEAISNSVRSGNYVTTTTTSWTFNYGKVVFTLQRPDGKKYRKTVKFVHDQGAAENLIRKAIS